MSRRHLVAFALVGALAASQAGCYGSYSAFHKVHTWNGNATGNKVANSAIHFGLWIVPVYPLLLTVDWLVLNNIEFITGEPVFD